MKLHTLLYTKAQAEMFRKICPSKIIYYCGHTCKIKGIRYINNKLSMKIVEFYDKTRIWLFQNEITNNKKLSNN